MRKFIPLILVIGAVGLLFIVSGCRNQQSAAQQSSQTTATTTTAAAPSESAEKITIAPDEAACPVLGTVMKKSMMIPVQHNGKTYYLCCRDCLAKWNADPEKYISHPAPLTRGMPH